MNHGGFLDHRVVRTMSNDIQAALESEDINERMQAQNRILNYLLMIRPNNSNGWLLGSFRYPNHMFANSENSPYNTDVEYLLLKGIFSYSDGDISLDWTDIKPLR